ncbi:hypothetical protein AAFF_G00293420 [Aldrovandia affinis]|uniref:Uncharacterized protein n=1 Tax=Aldrovandia affinis TaxID=143900 RepID=A0AAD7R9E4_9TELE|nr:hypothetical protein AAFF_G00293420 [Aldrovandia affinis]
MPAKDDGQTPEPPPPPQKTGTDLQNSRAERCAGTLPPVPFHLTDPKHLFTCSTAHRLLRETHQGQKKQKVQEAL